MDSNFSSIPKAKTLQYKLFWTIKKVGLSMREYLNKIKFCCEVLDTTGNPISPNNQILHILSGLGTQYDPIIVTVTAGSVTTVLVTFKIFFYALKLDLRVLCIRKLI